MPGFGTLIKTRVANLRHRAQVQSRVQSGTDDRGHPVFTWTSVSTIAFEMRMLSGAERETAHQLVPTATHRVQFRHNADVTEQTRLVFGARTFYVGFVEAVDQVERFSFALVTEDKQ